MLKNIVAAMSAAALATVLGVLLYKVATGADCLPGDSLEAGHCIMIMEN